MILFRQPIWYSVLYNKQTSFSLEIGQQCEMLAKSPGQLNQHVSHDPSAAVLLCKTTEISRIVAEYFLCASRLRRPNNSNSNCVDSVQQMQLMLIGFVLFSSINLANLSSKHNAFNVIEVPSN